MKMNSIQKGFLILILLIVSVIATWSVLTYSTSPQRVIAVILPSIGSMIIGFIIERWRLKVETSESDGEVKLSIPNMLSSIGIGFGMIIYLLLVGLLQYDSSLDAFVLGMFLGPFTFDFVGTILANPPSRRQ